MKHIRLLMALVILTNLSAFAHKQRTHQYVVREAWTMLQSQGFNLPALSSHLGYDQYSSNGNLTDPWIVAGAYNEDEADHVYYHGTPNNPLDAWFKPFTSVTHFWKIQGDQLHSYDGSGSVLTCVGTVENSYMKMCKFRDGAWNFWVRWQVNVWSQYRYYSLVDLYVNRRVYWIQDCDEIGQTTSHNCDLILTRDQADALTFNILGRMAHLLADMSLPAHVHSDTHDPICSWEDPYEQAMDINVNPTLVGYWNAANVLSSKGGYINPYGNHDDPLHFLLYTMNQIADFFPSRNVDGNATFAPVGEIAATLAAFSPPIGSSEYGQQPPSPNLASTIVNIRDASMPYLIRATAGLLYWFAVETRMYPPPTFAVSLGSGIIVEGGNGGTYQRGEWYQPYHVSLGSTYTGSLYLYDSLFAIPPSGCLFAGWSDGVFDNPRIIDGSLNVVPYYKSVHLTNVTTTWLLNNQRKHVQTPDGWQHIVYECNVGTTNHVFYENKAPGGSWQIVTISGPVRPFLDAAGGKSVAIDQAVAGTAANQIIIAFQEGTNIHLMTALNNGQGQYIFGPERFIPTGEAASTNVSPNVSWHQQSGRFMVVWKKSSGLSYTFGYLNGNCMEIIANAPQMISGTDASSNNAAVSCDKTYPAMMFDVTWEQMGVPQGGPPPVSIKTVYILFSETSVPCAGGTFNGSGQQFTAPLTVSSSAMKVNSHISTVSFSDDVAICWIADYSGTGDPWQTKAVVCLPWNDFGLFHTYYYYCKSTTANKLNDNDSRFYFAFSQIYNMQGWNDCNWAVSSAAWSTMQGLTTHGRDVQLCNGSSTSNMYVQAFYPTTSPYQFLQSGSLASVGLSKSSDGIVHNNRGIVLENGGAGVLYSLNDLFVDGLSIAFMPIPDSLGTAKAGPTIHGRRPSSTFMDRGTISEVLVSEPFDLKTNSEISFKDYFQADSLAATKLFGEKGQVTYAIELIDAGTGAVLGTIKSSLANSAKLHLNETYLNLLSNQNLPARTTRLRIKLETNIDSATFSLLDDYSDGKERSGLAKASVNALTWTKEEETVSEYSLEQNYPNPFNPVTTLRFGLAQRCHVLLTVFSVLGQQVAELQNGDMDAGYHEVRFDASGLASGVYFYRLRAGSFADTKKLLLVR